MCVCWCCFVLQCTGAQYPERINDKRRQLRLSTEHLHCQMYHQQQQLQLQQQQQQQLLLIRQQQYAAPSEGSHLRVLPIISLSETA
jgi:hypothetical protein